MRQDFLPKYKGDVEASTFSSHRRMFMLAIDRIDLKDLESISVRVSEGFALTWNDIDLVIIIRSKFIILF